VATDFEIRAWAKAQGLQISDDADIPTSMREAFDQAQSQPPPTAPPPVSPWVAPQSPWEVGGPNAHVPGGTDGVSIAALILGIIPVTAGVLGIVLGAIGLNRTKDGQRRGRGLAIAGIVLGSLWLIGIIVGVAINDSGKADRDAAGQVTSAGDVSTTDIRLGDCLENFATGVRLTVRVLPCTQPHGAEVYATFSIAGSSFPGDAEVRRLARGGCLSRIDTAVDAAAAHDPTYAVGFFRPTSGTWKQGDRGIACVIHRADDAKMSGSLRANQLIPGPAQP
jgi:hypothetical protein